MPFQSGPEHRERYVPSGSLQAQLAEIKLLLNAIRQLKITESRKRRMLVHVLWEVAFATGNTQSAFLGRYRTENVIRQPGLAIRRDHVYRKEMLVRDLLGDSPDLDEIIRRAQHCCVVTKEEHDKLDHGGTDGWERYRIAGIRVYDMATGQCVDFEEI